MNTKLSIRVNTISGTSFERGFVALFFVLTLSAALATLIFSLVLRAQYMFILLESFKNGDHARSSALYCKHRLYNTTLQNIEYIPPIGVDIATPYGSICRFESFVQTKNIRTAYIVGVYRDLRQGVWQSLTQGVATTTSQGSQATLHTFKIKYTYSITDEIFGYIHTENIERVE